MKDRCFVVFLFLLSALVCIVSCVILLRSDFFAPVMSSWKNVALFAAGIGLLVVALYVVLRRDDD